MSRKLRRKHRVVDAQLRKRVVISLFRRRQLHKNIIRQFPLRHLAEAVVILTQHHNIRIVIPGNKSVMADCTEQRTARQKIFDVVLAADPVNLKKIAEQDLLYFFKLSKVCVVKNENLAGLLQTFHQNDQSVLHRDRRFKTVVLNQLRVQKNAGRHE